MDPELKVYLDTMRADLDGRLDRLQNYVLELRTDLIGQYRSLDQRLNIMATTINAWDMRLAGLSQAVMDAPSRIDTNNLERRLARVEEHLKLNQPPA